MKPLTPEQAAGIKSKGFDPAIYQFDETTNQLVPSDYSMPAEAGKAFLRSLVAPVHELPQLQASVSRGVDRLTGLPSVAGAISGGLEAFGGASEALINKTLPQDPRSKDTWLGDYIPSGVGSLASFLVPGAALAKIGTTAKVAGRLTAGFGGLLEAEQARDAELARQVREGLPKNENLANVKAAIYGPLAAATEMAGAGRIAKQVIEGVQKAGLKGLARRTAGQAGLGFLEEGTQAGLQTGIVEERAPTAREVLIPATVGSLIQGPTAGLLTEIAPAKAPPRLDSVEGGKIPTAAAAESLAAKWGGKNATTAIPKPSLSEDSITAMTAAKKKWNPPGENIAVDAYVNELVKRDITPTRDGIVAVFEETNKLDPKRGEALAMRRAREVYEGVVTTDAMTPKSPEDAAVEAADQTAEFNKKLSALSSHKKSLLDEAEKLQTLMPGEQWEQSADRARIERSMVEVDENIRRLRNARNAAERVINRPAVPELPGQTLQGLEGVNIGTMLPGMENFASLSPGNQRTYIPLPGETPMYPRPMQQLLPAPVAEPGTVSTKPASTVAAAEEALRLSPTKLGGIREYLEKGWPLPQDLSRSQDLDEWISRLRSLEGEKGSPFEPGGETPVKHSGIPLTRTMSDVRELLSRVGPIEFVKIANTWGWKRDKNNTGLITTKDKWIGLPSFSMRQAAEFWAAYNKLPVGKTPEPRGDRLFVTPEQDAEYMAAVDRGDLETAQKMVDEAAKRAGLRRGYHGTEKPPFNVWRINNRDDLGAHFASSAAGAITGPNFRRVDAYLALKNPLRLEDKVGRWEADDLANQLENKLGMGKEEIFALVGKDSSDLIERDDVIAMLRHLRYDGIVYLNRGEIHLPGESTIPATAWADVHLFGRGMTDEKFKQKFPHAADSYIVLDPAQIKSTDAVTRDKQRNVIPLSRRFDPENADTRFSGLPRDTVKRFMKGVGEVLPTGAINVLSPEERAKNLKAFLADSKAVDKEGKPLVLFHTTKSPQGISENIFDVDAGIDELGTHFGSYDTIQGLGYRTDWNSSSSIWDVFAPPVKAIKTREGWMDYPVVLAVKNPLRMPDIFPFSQIADSKSDYQKARTKIVDEVKDPAARATLLKHVDHAFDGTFSARELRDELTELGYDGVVYDNSAEGGGDSWIIFDPAQAKSATGNTGRFNSEKQDIRYSGLPITIQREKVERTRNNPGADYERLLKKITNAQDTGDAEFVAGRELMQNSVDSTYKNRKLTGEEPIISFQNFDYPPEFSMLDNGTGMSPDFLANDYLSIGTTGKQIGEGGGLGLAKAQLFGRASESFEVISHVKDGETQTAYRSELNGTRAGFEAFQKRETFTDIKLPAEDFATTTTKVAPGITLKVTKIPYDRTLRGTFVRLRFPKGAKTSHAWRSANTSAKFLGDIAFGTLSRRADSEDRLSLLVIKPLPQDIENSYIGERSERTISPHKKFSLPVADVTIGTLIGANVGRRRGVYVSYLSNGLFQFNEYVSLPTSVELPEEFAVNVIAKVGGDDVGYPFGLDRKSVIPEISDVVKKELSTLAEQEVDRQTARYSEALEKAPKIGDTDIALLDATDSINQRDLQTALSHPMTKQVALYLRDLQKTISDTLVKKFPDKNFGNYTFTGILSGSAEAYGTRLGTKSPGSHGQIFLDPYLSWNWTKQNMPDIVGDPIESALAWFGRVTGTALHENLHQEIHGEDHELSVGLTKHLGDLVVASHYRKFAPFLEQITEPTAAKQLIEYLDEYNNKFSSSRNSEKTSSFLAGASESARKQEAVQIEDAGPRRGNVSPAQSGVPEGSSIRYSGLSPESLKKIINFLPKGLYTHFTRDKIAELKSRRADTAYAGRRLEDMNIAGDSLNAEIKAVLRSTTPDLKLLNRPVVMTRIADNYNNKAEDVSGLHPEEADALTKLYTLLHDLVAIHAGNEIGIREPNGTYRALIQQFGYIPSETMIDQSVFQAAREGGKEWEQLKADYIQNYENLHGAGTADEANKVLAESFPALGMYGTREPTLAANRLPQGDPLPESWRTKDVVRSLENYIFRFSRDISWAKFVQNDPIMRRVLGLKQDAFGRRPGEDIPEDPLFFSETSPEAWNMAMQEGRRVGAKWVDENPAPDTTPISSLADEKAMPGVLANFRQVSLAPGTRSDIAEAGQQFASSVLMQTLTGVRDFGTAISKTIPYMPAGQLPQTIISMAKFLSSPRGGIARAKLQGAMPDDILVAEQAVQTIGGSIARTLSSAAKSLRKFTGRKFLDELGKGLAYNLSYDAVLYELKTKGYSRIAQEFGGIEAKTPREMAESAGAYAARRLQPGYDFTALPAKLLPQSGTWQSFLFGLMRWNVSAYNKFYEDVWLPAVKHGKYGRLLGTMLAGTGIAVGLEKLLEAIIGRKPKDITFSEWVSLPSGTSEESLKKAKEFAPMFFAYHQLNGTFGIAGDIALTGARLAAGKQIPEPVMSPQQSLALVGFEAGNLVSQYLWNLDQGTWNVHDFGQLLLELTKLNQNARALSTRLDPDKGLKRDQMIFRELYHRSPLTGEPIGSYSGQMFMPHLAKNPWSMNERLKRADTASEWKSLLPSLVGQIRETGQIPPMRGERMNELYYMELARRRGKEEARRQLGRGIEKQAEVEGRRAVLNAVKNAVVR